MQLDITLVALKPEKDMENDTFDGWENRTFAYIAVGHKRDAFGKKC